MSVSSWGNQWAGFVNNFKYDILQHSQMLDVPLNIGLHVYLHILFCHLYIIFQLPVPTVVWDG